MSPEVSTSTPGVFRSRGSTSSVKASVSSPLSSAVAASRGVPQPPVADSPNWARIPRLAHRLQDSGLGRIVTVAVVAGVAPERLGRNDGAGLVVPFPVQSHAVVGAVVGQQRERRQGELGQLDGFVRRRHPRGLLQLGVEAGEEAALIPCRDVQRAARRNEGQQPR